MNQLTRADQLSELLASNRQMSSSFTHRRRSKSIYWQIERDYAVEIFRNQAEAFANVDLGSVKTALLDLAATGLTLSPNLGLCYLIPYQGRVKLEISYKGMEQLCYQYGGLKQLTVGLVRAGDHFLERHTGSGPDFEHAPKLAEAKDPPAPIVASYCMATFDDGARFYERIDQHDFKAILDAATKKNRGKVPFPYMLWPGEMWKKAVVRRAYKHWPKSPEMDAVTGIINNNSVPSDFGPAAPVAYDDPPGGALVISEHHVSVLRSILGDLFGEGHDDRINSWLTSLAEKYGINGIDNLPEHLYETAVQDLNQAAEKWEARAKEKARG